MRITVLAVAATLCLAACSSTGGGKELAVCDGRHVRPANLYGTVLAPASEGGTPAPSAAADEAKPKTLSSIGSPAALRSCGA